MFKIDNFETGCVVNTELSLEIFEGNKCFCCIFFCIL